MNRPDATGNLARGWPVHGAESCLAGHGRGVLGWPGQHMGAGDLARLAAVVAGVPGESCAGWLEHGQLGCWRLAAGAGCPCARESCWLASRRRRGVPHGCGR